MRSRRPVLARSINEPTNVASAQLFVCSLSELGRLYLTLSKKRPVEVQTLQCTDATLVSDGE